MRGTISYLLSEAGQKASLRSGGDGRQAQNIEVEVKPEDLDLFTVDVNGAISLDVGESVSENHSNFYAHGYSRDPRYLDVPLTYDAAIAFALDKRTLITRFEADYEKNQAEKAAEQKRAEEAERQKNEELRATRARVLAECAKHPEGTQITNLPGGAYQVANSAGATSVALNNPSYDEIRAIYTARDAAAKERAEQAKQKRFEPLRLWALAHGSERVRLMIEEKFDWLDVAREEFVDAHTPTGYGKVCADEEKERTKPTLGELNELRTMRELCAQSHGVMRNPQIHWNIDRNEDEDTGDETVDKFSTVDVTITTPDGETFIRSKRM